MLDLTGASLLTFLIREIRYVAAQHPRFKDSNGEALVAYSNLISFSDVKIQVSNLSAQGTRLSPDNYLATQMGRITVAKLETKPGNFIEWAREMDPDNLVPPAGIYYYNVDSVDESSQVVDFTMQANMWYEGRKESAAGSYIYFNSNINPASVLFSEPNVACVRGQNSILLLSYVGNDTTLRTPTSPLLPLVDYWVQCEDEIVLIEKTRGGVELVPYPANFETVDLYIDGRRLRAGTEYFVQDGIIRMYDFTPIGVEVLAKGIRRMDPSVVGFVHEENKFDFVLTSGSTLVEDPTVYYLSRELHRADEIVRKSDGTLWFQKLAPPGALIEWEARVAHPLETVQATKMMVSKNLLPGADVAIGDRVVVGDQCAIKVSPVVCETYELYGSKENVSFELEVSSNDIITTSELAELLRVYFTVTGRDRLETCGVTIFEASKSYRGESKDASGTAARHMATVSVAASADWEFFRPLVTRVDWSDLITIDANTKLPGNPTVPARYRQFGAFVFVPSYS
jgi:hypothetical protein